MFTFAIF
jgi:hypothetical protein